MKGMAKEQARFFADVRAVYIYISRERIYDWTFMFSSGEDLDTV